MSSCWIRLVPKSGMVSGIYHVKTEADIRILLGPYPQTF